MINFKLRLQNKATLVALISTDPTTKGVADSERALNYNQPRED